MTKSLKSTLNILMLLVTAIGSAQQLKVSDFKQATFDISARENPVYDPNGDGCAIIKARTGISGMTFSSDLEIKKVVFRDGEYWLWVSPGTRIISMEAPGFPRIEFKLPYYTEEFNVYIIFLTAVLSEHTIIKSPRTVSFTTVPKHAEVYINNIFYGHSPIKMDIPTEIFEYRLEKKKFLTIKGNDTTKGKPTDYSVRLSFDPDAKRYYTIVNIGLSAYGGVMMGINFGKIGKTNGYVSLFIRNPQLLGLSTLNHWLDATDPENIKIDDEFYFQGQKKLGRGSGLVGGINQKLNSNFFLNMGLGYSFSEILIQGKKIPYSTDNQNITKAYAASNKEVDLAINTGITFRIKNRILVNVNDNILLSLWKISQQSESFTFNFNGIDLNLGLGYNF